MDNDFSPRRSFCRKSGCMLLWICSTDTRQSVLSAFIHRFSKFVASSYLRLLCTPFVSKFLAAELFGRRLVSLFVGLISLRRAAFQIDNSLAFKHWFGNCIHNITLVYHILLIPYVLRISCYIILLCLLVCCRVPLYSHILIQANSSNAIACGRRNFGRVRVVCPWWET